MHISSISIKDVISEILLDFFAGKLESLGLLWENNFNKCFKDAFVKILWQYFKGVSHKIYSL